MMLTSAFAEDAPAQSDNDKLFYFLGTAISRNVVPLDLTDAETEAVIKGFRAALAGNAEELDEAVYGPQLNSLAQERMAASAAKENALAEEYLEKMAGEKGAVTSESGLIYVELSAGDGAQPTAASTVTAHYQGTLRDGTVFDSSYQRNQPLTIPLNSVIPCWTEAIAMMKVGGKSRITCPADIAYGDRASGAIPPGSALTFEVELLDVAE